MERREVCNRIRSGHEKDECGLDPTDLFSVFTIPHSLSCQQFTIDGENKLLVHIRVACFTLDEWRLRKKYFRTWKPAAIVEKKGESSKSECASRQVLCFNVNIKICSSSFHLFVSALHIFSARNRRVSRTKAGRLHTHKPVDFQFISLCETHKTH